MQRITNYALATAIPLLIFTSTSLSQTQAPRPESSPTRTSQLQQPKASPTKFFKTKKPIPNRYIVVLNDDVVSDNAPLKVRRARITAIAKRHARKYRGKYDFIYETALKGYAIQLPNEAAAIAISKLPEVRWVEEDGHGDWTTSR